MSAQFYLHEARTLHPRSGRVGTQTFVHGDLEIARGFVVKTGFGHG